MGLETAPQRALQVPIGPLVTPANPESANATVIGDAMRKGFITAEEVVDRIGQRAQAKNAADIAQSQAAVPVAQAQAMAAQEAMSPQAQAMRAQHVQSAMDEDKLKRDAAAWEVVNKQNSLDAKLNLLSLYGEPYPLIPGQVPTAEDIGNINKSVQEILEFKREGPEAAQQIVKTAKPSDRKFHQDNVESTQYGYQTDLEWMDKDEYEKGLAPFSQQTLQQWRQTGKKKVNSFFGAPGVVSSTPPTGQPAAKAVVEPKSVTVPIPFPGGAFPSTVVIPEEAPATPQVTPQATPAGLVEPNTSGVPALGSVTSEGFVVTGTKSSRTPDKNIPSEGINKLMQVQFAVDNVADIAKRYSELKASSPNLIGVVKGRVVGPLLGQWDAEYKRLENAVKSTVPGMARGVFGEVGVLSNADIQQYGQLLPNAKTDPAIAEWILRDITEKTNRAVKKYLDTYEQAGYNVEGFAATRKKSEDALASLGGGPAAAPTGAVTSPISQNGKNYRLVILPNGMKKYQLAN